MKPGARPRSRRSRCDSAGLLRAALAVFADAGFGHGRVADVAAAARMSNGAVYLRFPSKSVLFEAAVRAAIEGYDADRTREERAALVRVLVAEGARFPHLAELFHAKILAPRIAAIRGRSLAAVGQGAWHLEPFVRFPELLLAPGLLACMWNMMFGHLDPLEEQAFVSAYGDLVLRSDPRPASRFHGEAGHGG